MTKSFDAKNWYWFVGGGQTKAYSSLSGNYVPSNDQTFVSWQEDGTLPTNIDTEANLGAVLAPYHPDVTRPIPTGIVSSYQQEQADDIFKHKLIKFLFVLHNRVRALEGQAPHTIQQAKNYFRGLM